MKSFIIKEEEGIEKSDSCIILGENSFINIANKIKLKIIKLLSIKSLFISEISKELKINEQNVYYHLSELKPILKVVEEKKIRGVIAKKYSLISNNICFNLKDSFSEYLKEKQSENNIKENIFFNEFIYNNQFNGKIIVGSPDPHGPFKARCRDGHYAIDLSFYLGGVCNLQKDFSVSLDVDVNLETEKNNLIVVGGPVTNLIMNQISDFLPVKFLREKHWAIKTLKNEYTDDNIGLIAKIPHPFFQDCFIITIAGIRFSGTKAAVIALTRNTKLTLNKFSKQKKFFTIIQGFDLDGDGKIDSIEILE
jgi:hypothetical protein